jgi:hypothetical protein
MPVVMTKPRARITDVIMAITLFSYVEIARSISRPVD